MGFLTYNFVDHPALGISMVLWLALAIGGPPLVTRVLLQRWHLAPPLLLRLGVLLVLMEPLISPLLGYEHYCYPFFLLYIAGWVLLAGSIPAALEQGQGSPRRAVAAALVVGVAMSTLCLLEIRHCDYGASMDRMGAYVWITASFAIICVGRLMIPRALPGNSGGEHGASSQS